MIAKRPISPENAKARLESLCARSEHCTHELAMKLRGWGIAPDVAERIIEELQAARFVDDSRFARAFALDRMRFSSYGRIKIRMALAAKRIPRDVIDDAIAAIDEDEYLARLESLMATRYARTADADTYEGRTRIYRYGCSRGFESDLVARCLRQLIASNANN